jgi:VWFA-related protein
MKQPTLLMLLAACAAVAQEPPTFSFGEQPAVSPIQKMVQLDVVVQKRYKTQTNLTASDFRITDDGFPREVELFRVNDARVPHKPSPALEPGAVSNRVDQEGNELQSATVVLIDRADTLPGDWVRMDEGVLEELASARTGARIAICLLTSDRLTVLQDFTTNRARLVDAVESVHADPHADTGTGLLVGKGQLEADKQAARALLAIARHLAGLPGRKNLVWFTSDLPFETWLEPSPAPVQGNSPNRPGDALPTADSFSKFRSSVEINKAARVLNEAGIAVYFGGSPRTTPGSWGRNSMVDFLRAEGTILSLTGGRRLLVIPGRILNKVTPFALALEDAEFSYTVGFQPAVSDESLHDLAVGVVKKPASVFDAAVFDVHTRAWYFASRPGTPDRAHLAQERSELLASPLDATQIEIRASLKPDVLTVRVNLDDLTLKHGDGRWKGGIAVASGSEPVLVPIDLSDEQYKASRTTGFVVTVPAATRSGVVVQDQASGALGSVTLARR